MNRDYKNYMSELLKRVYPHHVVAVDDAPEKYGDLVQQVNLTVYAGNSDLTIYGAPEDNHRFRAWHDSLHLGHGLSFNDAHEYAVAREHAKIFETYSAFAADMVYADVQGQVDYLNVHGEFPTDQITFIESLVKVS